MTTVPANIKTHYGMGMYVTNNNWFHEGEETWGTSALWFKTAKNVCFAIACNTLPTINGTEEEKYEVMKKYARELVGLFPKSFEKITSWPNINLYDNYK
jgi:hypothetical protein